MRSRLLQLLPCSCDILVAKPWANAEDLVGSLAALNELKMNVFGGLSAQQEIVLRLHSQGRYFSVLGDPRQINGMTRRPQPCLRPSPWISPSHYVSKDFISARITS